MEKTKRKEKEKRWTQEQEVVEDVPRVVPGLRCDEIRQPHRKTVSGKRRQPKLRCIWKCGRWLFLLMMVATNWIGAHATSRKTQGRSSEEAGPKKLKREASQDVNHLSPSSRFQAMKHARNFPECFSPGSSGTCPGWYLRRLWDP